MVKILNLLRVKHWIKNTFIFFPLLFSGQLFRPDLLQACLWTFAGFCLISSGLYILNDFLDAERDRVHPQKALRVLAQEHIHPLVVILSILLLQGAGLWICRDAGSLVLLVGIFYILLHLLYNFYTKKIVILDVIFVAIGFHFRILAGGAAAQVFPSVWLQMCVFILALFLGFTKRRYELAALKEKAPEHRSVLAHYTAYMLDQIIMICSTLAIVFYGLYTISSDIVDRIGSHNMAYSVAFVIYGFFRYLYLIHVRKMGDDPADILLRDAPLLLCVLLWIGYVGVLIYL